MYRSPVALDWRFPGFIVKCAKRTTLPNSPDTSLSLMQPTQLILVALIAFAAGFVQTVAGFGSALLGMPLLVAVVGIQIAPPLVAMLGVALEMVLILRYREHMHVAVVGKLVAAAAVGIPLGIYAVKNIDQRIVLGVLAVVLVGYGIYGLSKFALPKLEGNGWTFGLGFIAGVLGGAYNTAGPPVIMYGHAPLANGPVQGQPARVFPAGQLLRRCRPFPGPHRNAGCLAKLCRQSHPPVSGYLAGRAGRTRHRRRTLPQAGAGAADHPRRKPDPVG